MDERSEPDLDLAHAQTVDDRVGGELDVRQQVHVVDDGAGVEVVASRARAPPTGRLPLPPAA